MLLVVGGRITYADFTVTLAAPLRAGLIFELLEGPKPKGAAHPCEAVTKVGRASLSLSVTEFPTSERCSALC